LPRSGDEGGRGERQREREKEREREREVPVSIPANYISAKEAVSLAFSGERTALSSYAQDGPRDPGAVIIDA